MKKKSDFILGRLNEQIKWFDDEANKHKRLHRTCRYLLFLLTSASAIFAGVGLMPLNLWPKIIIDFAILIISSAIAAVTSFEGLRKPGELWVSERTVHYQLLDLRRQLEYDLSVIDPATDIPNADEYFSRMQTILSASTEKWSRYVRPSANESLHLPQSNIAGHSISSATENSSGSPSG